MKNITLTIDDETHRKARIRAAELGTSVSAMVKDYLNGLVDDPLPQQGMREMPMTFIAEPLSRAQPVPAKGGPPWFINGQWSYTQDGKPRQPGSIRGMWVADDFDEWPAEMQNTFDAWDHDDLP